MTFSAVPDSPRGPLNISNITPKSCDLSWKSPDKDGGSPITEYVIESSTNEEDSIQNGGDTDFPAFEPLHVLITSTNEHKKYYQSIRPKSPTNIKWKRTLASRSNQEQHIHESNSSEYGPIKRTRYNSCSHQPPEVIFCNWKHSDVEEACNG